MDIVAASGVIEGILLFFVGLLCGVAARKAILPLLLLGFGMVIAGYLQLALPFNATRVLYDMVAVEYKSFFLLFSLNGVEWVWFAGMVVGFLFSPFSRWLKLPLKRVKSMPIIYRRSAASDEDGRGADAVD